MRGLYTLVAYLLAPLYCAALWWRGWRERAYWQNFSERFGSRPRTGDRRSADAAGIWVHAASMGEVQAAAALIRALRDRYPKLALVVTTITPAGRERAHALFGTSVHLRYLPLDLPGAVRRFLDGIQPRVGIIFETEIWPNLYRECAHRGIPLILASARLSARSASRYRRFPSLFEEIFPHVVIAAQTEDDAARFRSIGAPAVNIHITGNIKFDLSIASEVLTRGRALRQKHAGERPVWVAGSTHPREEQILLDAHRLLTARVPGALLIMVPRHPPRFGEVADWLARERIAFARRSQNTRVNAAPEVLLVDTMGELMDFYAAADVAFVGGSLVPIGGHNLLEPAALGLPVTCGPHFFNAPDVARLLIDKGAVIVVTTAQQLSDQLATFLADAALRARVGALGRAVVEENRGTLGKILQLIEPALRG